MATSSSSLSARERAVLGAGLIAFLVLLGFAARSSNDRLTVTAEIVAAALLALGIAVGWWRRARLDRTHTRDE